MSPEFEAIVQQLRANPDMFYVTEDGKNIFVLLPDDQLMAIVGEGFDKMSAEELNRKIQNAILDLMNQQQK